MPISREGRGSGTATFDEKEVPQTSLSRGSAGREKKEGVLRPRRRATLAVSLRTQEEGLTAGGKN